MAILDIQRRLTEVGRIRIGQQLPIGKTGKTRPAKLDTFRLTSPDRRRIECAAKLYGGTVQPWQAPAGPQYEVITTATSLPVIVPPGDIGLSQWMELWSGGGCQRRCNTNQATYIDGGNLVDGECLCDPDNRECKPHTRLSVMLRDLPGIGLWRLDTQGWNAALELLGAVEILETAGRLGVMIPAELRLDQRMIKRPGQQTRRFAVPVLDPTGTTPGQLAAGNAAAIPAYTADRALDAEIHDGIRRGELIAATPVAAPQGTLTPVPADTNTPPTIAEQTTPPPPRRTRGQIPITPTGIAPRTAAQAATQTTPAEAEQPELPTSPGRRPHDEPVWPKDLLDMPPPENPDAEETRYITPAQLTKLSIQLNQAGLGGKTDEAKQARHDFVAAIIGHTIESAKQLTMAEAGDVIDILENQPPPPEE